MQNSQQLRVCSYMGVCVCVCVCMQAVKWLNVLIWKFHLFPLDRLVMCMVRVCVCVCVSVLCECVLCERVYNV